jgi:hypothetical protein
MTRAVVILAIAAVIAAAPALATAHSSKPGAAPPPRLMAGLGGVHHPVSTKNREAQRFFGQGLALASKTLACERDVTEMVAAGYVPMRYRYIHD